MRGSNGRSGSLFSYDDSDRRGPFYDLHPVPGGAYGSPRRDPDRRRSAGPIPRFRAFMVNNKDFDKRDPGTCP